MNKKTVLSSLPFELDLYKRVGNLYCQCDKFLINIAPTIISGFHEIVKEIKKKKKIVLKQGG